MNSMKLDLQRKESEIIHLTNALNEKEEEVHLCCFNFFLTHNLFR